MTTLAAREVGGTTKFDPWTTSWCPTNHSSGGSRPWRQAACSGRAGIGRCLVVTPGGTRSSMPRRRRQLTAKALTSSSARRDSAPRAPSQNRPTPVGWPSSGVASKATVRVPTARAPSSRGVVTGGTRRALHIRPEPPGCTAAHGPRRRRQPERPVPTATLQRSECGAHGHDGGDQRAGRRGRRRPLPARAGRGRPGRRGHGRGQHR